MKSLAFFKKVVIVVDVKNKNKNKNIYAMLSFWSVQRISVKLTGCFFMGDFPHKLFLIPN